MHTATRRLPLSIAELQACHAGQTAPAYTPVAEYPGPQSVYERAIRSAAYTVQNTPFLTPANQKILQDAFAQAYRTCGLCDRDLQKLWPQA